MRRALPAGVLAVVLAVAACGGGDGAGGPATFVALDGTPRLPDAVGVVTELAEDFSTLTIDDGRTFAVDPAVQSFSTIDASTQPLRSRVGQYVHLGLDGDRVVWLASIGSVQRLAGRPEIVHYVGIPVDEHEGDTVTFEDGTVLSLAPGVDVELGHGPVAVELDVATDTVTAVVGT